MSLRALWDSFSSGWMSEHAIELRKQMKNTKQQREAKRQESDSKHEFNKTITDLTTQIKEYDKKISAMGIQSHNEEGLSLEHLQTMRGLLETQRQTVIRGLENHTIKSTESFTRRINFQILQQLSEQKRLLETMNRVYSPDQVEMIIQSLMVDTEAGRISNERIQNYLGTLKQKQIDPMRKQQEQLEFDKMIADKIDVELSMLPIPNSMLVEHSFSISPPLQTQSSSKDGDGKE